MRAFVQAEYAESPAQPVVFKIDTLCVQGDFAYLECLPLPQAQPPHLTPESSLLLTHNTAQNQNLIASPKTTHFPTMPPD